MTTNSDRQLLFEPAWRQLEMLDADEVSARELMQLHLAQIERVNGDVNAIVTLVDGDQLLAQADAADAARANAARTDDGALLAGLPVGIKDLQPTRGIRTTYGSPIFADNIPNADSLVVQRYREHGAIVVGKTNTPEFGAGSQTFNDVFGATLNPYDRSRTCGGSSGGAAVALACGMLPIAQGSDFGGSLRNPAAWCNVVGMRNSIGVVPDGKPLGYTHESVTGAMARTVRDVHLQLRALAGYRERIPNSLPPSVVDLSAPLDGAISGTRIAWSRNLGGAPIDPAVTAVLDAQRAVFEDLGCIVEDAEPPLADAGEIFRVLRAALFAHQHADNLERHRNLMKDTLIWNVEEGLELSALDVKRAEEARTALFGRMIDFMAQYDIIAAPVTSVPPFAIDLEYPTEVAGEPMDDYLQWMAPCAWVTVTGLPAISVPAGFDDDHLPYGLQLIGRRYADLSVLRTAHAFEQATGYWKQAPEWCA